MPTEAPATAPESQPSRGFVARLLDEARRVPPWWWALAFAVLLCLPRLARFGFWDPWELKLAEQARDIARSDNLFDATAGGKYPGSHALAMLLSALGIRLLGASELGARLPIALSAVGALLAVYWAGRGLLRPRAALLATLALGTMPLFVLEARQLTSDAPLIATLALALGALGRFAWPPDGRRRARDLAIALVSLALGTYAGGALLGFVLPVLAIVAALIIGYGLTPNASDVVIADGTGPLSDAGVGRDIPADRPLGASTLHPGARGGAWVVFAALGVAALVVLIVAMTHLVAGKYSWLLGGVPRGGAPTKTFEALIRQLGFGLFPWSAVAIFALARPLTRLDGDGGSTNTRLTFVSLYLLVFAGMGFALSGYLNVVQSDVRYVALPAIALAIGAFLDEALEGNSAEPVAGLLMAIGTLIIARDFFLSPEELASVHVNDKVKWPATIQLGWLFMAVGLVSATGIYCGLAARRRAVGNAPAVDRSSLGRIRKLFDRLSVTGGRYGLQTAVACAVVFAFYIAQGLVPRLSTHLSFKPVLESYAKFAQGGEKIGKYRIEGHGSTFYSKQTMVDLPTQDRVVQFLRDPGARVRDGPDRRSGGAGRRVQAGARPLLRRRRVVVAVPAAHQPARARAARRQPAVEKRLDAARGRPEREAALDLARAAVVHVRRRHRAGGRGLPAIRPPAGQDPARPHLPHQGEGAGQLQDLPALRRARRAARHRRPRSAEQGVRDQLLAARRIHPGSLRHRRAVDDHPRRDLHGVHGFLAGGRGQAPEGDAGQPRRRRSRSPRHNRDQVDWTHCESTRQREAAQGRIGDAPTGGAPAPTAAFTRA